MSRKLYRTGLGAVIVAFVASQPGAGQYYYQDPMYDYGNPYASHLFESPPYLDVDSQFVTESIPDPAVQLPVPFKAKQSVQKVMPSPKAGAKVKPVANATSPTKVNSAVLKNQGDASGASTPVIPSRAAALRTLNPDSAPCPCEVRSSDAQPTEVRAANYQAGPANIIGIGLSAGKIPKCPQYAHILDVYPDLPLDCKCGKEDNCKYKLKRYDSVPSGVDPNCLTCVQEPFICEECDEAPMDVVVHSCKCDQIDRQKQECVDGKCVTETVTKVVKQVIPCKGTIQVSTTKIVIQYRPVWIEIICPPSSSSSSAPCP